jgi:3-phosphoshikimate 1-carboxyvinyltransferase
MRTELMAGQSTAPATLEIQPLSGRLDTTILPPGSKSITNRALLLAALSESRCELHNALECDDTEVMIRALQTLGFEVEVDWSRHTVAVSRPPHAPIVPNASAELFLGNSGTSMRFLTAALALGHGRYRLDGTARMRERPIEDLLEALRALGVQAASEQNNGCPPVCIESDGLQRGPVSVKGDTSSQFLSGLLMCAPLARGDVTIEVSGRLVSLPYVEMTLAMVQAFGGKILRSGESQLHIPGRQQYHRDSYLIEPDATSAGYFFAAAAICGGTVAVPLPRESLQGDWRFVDVLERMGCQVSRAGGMLQVTGDTLSGIDVDMNDISDCVMTLAVTTCFAAGPTRIRNVGHIRHKECDRISALAAELNRLGARVTEYPDGLVIQPAPLHGAILKTYGDHRMAMALALAGLRVPGVLIADPACASKTYPRFFEDLSRLGRPPL